MQRIRRKRSGYRGNKPIPFPDTFKGLPGLLADMLPDRYGNELINLRLTQQGRPENSMNPGEMLCFIGKRGIGALEIEPAILKQNVHTFSERETTPTAAAWLQR